MLVLKERKIFVVEVLDDLIEDMSFSFLLSFDIAKLKLLP